MTARRIALALASGIALSVGLACQPAEQQVASVSTAIVVADAGFAQTRPESVELAQSDGGLGKCAEWGYQRGVY